jgi:hypothetical protein
MSVVVNRAGEGVISVAARKRPSIRAHIQIARLDHWIKHCVQPGTSSRSAWRRSGLTPAWRCG